MQIVPMLLQRFLDHLAEHSQSNVPIDNPVRADVVKIGLLQIDPVKSNIQLGISGGDHDFPDEQDGIVTLRGLPHVGMDLKNMVREVGGGQIWMRRGVVQIKCFFINEKFDETKAHEVAYNVLGKVLELMETTPMTGLVDDFGERFANGPYCYANTFFQSGGPPNQYIFRGKASWAVFTERP